MFSCGSTFNICQDTLKIEKLLHKQGLVETQLLRTVVYRGIGQDPNMTIQVGVPLAFTCVCPCSIQRMASFSHTSLFYHVNSLRCLVRSMLKLGCPVKGRIPITILLEAVPKKMRLVEKDSINRKSTILFQIASDSGNITHS